MRRSPGVAIAVTALGPISWGTTYLVTTQWLPPGRPLLSGLLRALPAGLVLLAVTRRLPAGSWWWRAGVLGMLNIGAFFPLLFLSAYRLPGGVAATLGAIAPLLVAGLARWLLGEHAGRWRLGWGVAGVIGVALLVLRAGAALDGVGVLAGVLATMGMSTATVLTKRWGQPVPVLTFTAWQLVAGGLALVPVTLLVEGAPPALGLPAVLGYLWLGAVGTVMAYALWFRGLRMLPAGQAAFLPLLSPIVAAVIGWVVLGQGLTGWQLAGFGLALTAIVAAQLPRSRT